MDTFLHPIYPPTHFPPPTTYPPTNVQGRLWRDKIHLVPPRKDQPAWHSQGKPAKLGTRLHDQSLCIAQLRVPRQEAFDSALMGKKMQGLMLLTSGIKRNPQPGFSRSFITVLNWCATTALMWSLQDKLVSVVMLGWTFFPARPTYNPSLADCQAAFGMIPTNTTGVTIATKAQFTSVSCGIYFNGDRPMGLTDFATVAAYLIVNNTSPDGRSTGGSAAGVPVAQQRNNTGLSVVVDFQYKTGNDQGTNFDIAVDNSIDEILQNYKVPNDPDWATYPWNDEFMASLGKFVSIDSGIQARDASVAYSDPASSLPSIPLEDCTPGLQRNEPITPSCVGLQCQSDSDCCDGYHCGSTMIGSTKSCQQGGD
eukprot:jgi/Astpho2/3972/Aster-01147